MAPPPGGSTRPRVESVWESPGIFVCDTFGPLPTLARVYDPGNLQGARQIFGRLMGLVKPAPRGASFRTGFFRLCWSGRHRPGASAVFGGGGTGFNPAPATSQNNSPRPGVPLIEKNRRFSVKTQTSALEIKRIQCRKNSEGRIGSGGTMIQKPDPRVGPRGTGGARMGVPSGAQISMGIHPESWGSQTPADVGQCGKKRV